ncbi:hypothetical protein RDABS01_013946 [Bienertia sinuspersici]
MELALASKRKLGFINGEITKEKENEKKKQLWDICNSVVISWLHNSLNETIRRSVLYYNSAREIWLQLEKRFTVSNGALKYKLNKQLYETKQDGMSIRETEGGEAVLTPQQVEQLLKLLPENSSVNKEKSETEDDLETPFSGMVMSCKAITHINDWIIDSRASDHMIHDKALLSNVSHSKIAKAIGKVVNGIYYLINMPFKKLKKSYK